MENENFEGGKGKRREIRKTGEAVDPERANQEALKKYKQRYEEGREPRIFSIGSHIEGAKEILFSFNVGEKLQWLIPPGARERSEDEKKNRTPETFKDVLSIQGGKIDDKTLTRTQQRPGIFDLGIEITPKNGLRLCEGGATLYRELIEEGWKPVDLYWELELTQSKKVKGDKKATFKVVLAMSKERQEIIFRPETWRILKQLLGLTEINANGKRTKITWGFSHIWDNTDTPWRSITVNFGMTLFGSYYQKPESTVSL